MRLGLDLLTAAPLINPPFVLACPKKQPDVSCCQDWPRLGAEYRGESISRN